jgi:hypothetical protein
MAVMDFGLSKLPDEIVALKAVVIAACAKDDAMAYNNISQASCWSNRSCIRFLH